MQGTFSGQMTAMFLTGCVIICLGGFLDGAVRLAHRGGVVDMDFVFGSLWTSWSLFIDPGTQTQLSHEKANECTGFWSADRELRAHGALVGLL